MEVPPGKEIIQVRAPLPINLDLAPVSGLATITKSSPSTGIREGDVLRYCSQFTMGLPRGDGIITTVGSFGGAIGWQCSLFNVKNARKWEEVVEALVSNDESRTDYCLMLFERDKEE